MVKSLAIESSGDGKFGDKKFWRYKVLAIKSLAIQSLAKEFGGLYAPNFVRSG